MTKQPYYMIDFSASACLFEIRVNDYPVIHMNVEGQVASNIPINYAILKSGTQSISVTILPNVGDLELHPKSEVKFNIKIFDVTNDFVFDQQFGDYQSETVGEKKIPVIKHIGTFKAEVPYQLEVLITLVITRSIKTSALTLAPKSSFPNSAPVFILSLINP